MQQIEKKKSKKEKERFEENQKKDLGDPERWKR